MFLLFIFFPHIIDLKLASQLYHCRIPHLIQDSNVTGYGRQLSIIRTSCNDNSVDQYEHVQLSLERLDLNSVQTEEQNTENSSEGEIKRIPNES
jgi:hypothetical protein